VEKVFTTSGRFDFLLQVACPNTSVLDQVLDQIGAMTGVKASESLIHLSTKIDRAV
jgi:Lrp/AsnC ligand binding domain